MTDGHFHKLWPAVVGRLDSGLPHWRDLIAHYGQVSAIKERSRGRQWSDSEVFEALVRSVLSNSTDWAKVEKVLPQLSGCFHGFDPRWYSSLSACVVEQTILPWFKDRRAGSMTLRRDLKQLVNAAKALCDVAKSEGSLDAYFRKLSDQSAKDTKRTVVALGSLKSPNKLPTLGIPLAAEFLKNLGFDVSKPDRHINRAVGSFGWVRFAKWPLRDGTKAPTASEAELFSVMEVMERFGQAAGLPTAYVDNAVWLLCAKSGLHLSNADLSRLVAQQVPAAH